MLLRHSSRLYMDEYDLEGVLNVLSRRIGESDEESIKFSYYGAYTALRILCDTEQLNTQQDFMAVIDAAFENEKEAI